MPVCLLCSAVQPSHLKHDVCCVCSFVREMESTRTTHCGATALGVKRHSTFWDKHANLLPPAAKSSSRKGFTTEVSGNSSQVRKGAKTSEIGGQIHLPTASESGSQEASVDSVTEDGSINSYSFTTPSTTQCKQSSAKTFN